MKKKKNSPLSLPSNIKRDLERLKIFIEMNPRPIVEISNQGHITHINKAAIDLFPTLKKSEQTHPYLKNFKEIVRSLKTIEQPLIREIQLKKVWYRQIFYYIPEYKLVLIYASDITEQKKNIEELKISEKRYRMLFEKMNYAYGLQDIIFDKNKKPVDYRFVDINSAFEELSGVKKENIIGKTINQLNVINKNQNNKPVENKENDKNRRLYNKVVVTGKPHYLESYNKALKKHFSIYAYKPNFDQISLIFRDVTREKNDEENKNNFIAMMSHELRNPLTPILANAQMMKSMLGEQHPLRESTDIIEKQAKIMADLLDDVLTMFRLKYNKIILRKGNVNVPDAIKNAIDSSMPFMQAKEQNISFISKKNPIYIDADKVKMEQILTNLINNASKYTDVKGNISLTSHTEGKMAVIRIKDTGIGMDKLKIKKIFKLFSDDSQPFMGIGGLGVGLNIVKRLIDLHQGTISVTSEGKNKGSEFIISFPLSKNIPNDIVQTLKKTATASLSLGRNILIIEDNKDIRDTIAKILINRGHSIKSTYSGNEGVKIAREFGPKVVLVDIGLPDINGYQVAKKLYQQYGNTVNLIAFTGYGQKSDKLAAKAAGFKYHLTKPIDIEKLIHLVEE